MFRSFEMQKLFFFQAQQNKELLVFPLAYFILVMSLLENLKALYRVEVTSWKSRATLEGKRFLNVGKQGIFLLQFF